MPMFQQFPLGCAIRKRAFGVTVESLGSLALHRELQTKLPPLQFPGQMELRQDVIHHAPTARFFLARLGRDYMVVAAGREPTETCGQTIWGTGLCACPHLPAKEGSAEPAASCGDPRPGRAWVPQLMHSADPALGSCEESCLGEAGDAQCPRSWPLAPAPLPSRGTMAAAERAAVTAALFASGMLCHSASGLATSLLLME